MNENYAGENACFILFGVYLVFSFSQGKDGIRGVPGKPGLKVAEISTDQTCSWLPDETVST